MLILVTGSTGFVGSQLCRALAARGHRVRASPPPHQLAARPGGRSGRASVGDITQPDSLEAAMRGVEAVFHAAAQLDGSTDVKRTYRVTVEGTGP